MTEHPATPGCKCDRCQRVFDAWGREVEQFMRWVARHPELIRVPRPGGNQS